MSYNIVDIFLDATSGSVTLTNPIPKQTLKLISYRIHFSSANEAHACGYVKVDFPFFRGNSFIKGCTTGSTNYDAGIQGLTLPTNNEAVTLEFPDCWIGMSDKADTVFNYRLSGINLTGFTGMHLVFGFDSGGIV